MFINEKNEAVTHHFSTYEKLKGRGGSPAASDLNFELSFTLAIKRIKAEPFNSSAKLGDALYSITSHKSVS